MSNVYLTSQDLSKAIGKMAEDIEQIKKLKAAIGTTKEEHSGIDWNVVRRYEQDLRDEKWGIAQFLGSEHNYNQWLASEKNNAALLYKYVQRGHLAHEIGPDEDLARRLEGLKVVFEATPKDFLITRAEKDTINHYKDMHMDADLSQVPTYEAEEKAILNVHDKEKCFQKELKHSFEHFPTRDRLPKDVQSVLNAIEKNDMLLKDHPYHIMVNPGYQQATVDNQQLRSLVARAFVGDKEAIAGFRQLQESFEAIDKKVPHVINQKKIRENYTVDTPNIGPKNI